MGSQGVPALRRERFTAAACGWRAATVRPCCISHITSVWRAIRTGGTCSCTATSTRFSLELDPEERQGLELTDEEIHDRLPAALDRHYTDNRDDLLMVPGEQYNQASWDAPVRLLQNHFV